MTGLLVGDRGPSRLSEIPYVASPRVSLVSLAAESTTVGGGILPSGNGARPASQWMWFKKVEGSGSTIGGTSCKIDSQREITVETK